LTEACDTLLSELTDLEKKYPNYIKVTLEPSGEMKDAKAFETLYKTFNKDLDGAIRSLAKASPDKVQKLAQELKKIAEIYLQNVQKAPEGLLSPKFAQPLEALIRGAKSIAEKRVVTLKESDLLIKAARTWSDNKHKALADFQNKAKLSKSEVTDRGKDMKAGFEKFQKLNYKANIALVKNGHPSTRPRRRSCFPT
jgi:hypothetical protein